MRQHLNARRMTLLKMVILSMAMLVYQRVSHPLIIGFNELCYEKSTGNPLVIHWLLTNYYIDLGKLKYFTNLN